jgi:hypothetical protein
MKIIVMNFSGNVGKSTVARHLLSPRMNNAKIIPVESINSDGTQDEAIRGKQYGALLEILSVLDDSVIDVGASNVEDFVALMKKYDGSHDDFDYFVIPTVKNTKQQHDTISTIEALHDIGIPAKSIRLVFNMVDDTDNLQKSFDSLFKYHASSKKFTLKPDAVIHENEIFLKLKNSAESISDILSDPTDLKELLKAATEPNEKMNIAAKIGVKRLASGVTKELDGVYKTLFN